MLLDKLLLGKNRSKQVALEVDKNGYLKITAKGEPRTLASPDLVYCKYKRFTLAEVKADTELIAGVPGYKIRMVDCFLTAIGGAAGAADGVKVMSQVAGTAGAALVTATTAVLTENTLKRVGDTNVAPLSAGLSFAGCDAGANVYVGDYGASALTTLTHLDVVFSYCLDPA